MTDLTLLFLEGWRRLGNLRQEKWLNAVSRVYWAVLVRTWKTVLRATETMKAPLKEFGRKHYIRNWMKDHSYDISAKNMVIFCSCLKNLSKAKY